MDKVHKQNAKSMNETEMPKVFVSGAISPDSITDVIARQSAKTNIGAHDIFIGQIRNDVIEGKTVQAIDYTAYEEMAEEKFHEIREAAFTRFNLIYVNILHSLGKVRAGEISLFVFVASPHRADAFDACRFIVEEIKANVPIWGKEIFDDETYSWKVNTL